MSTNWRKYFTQKFSTRYQYKCVDYIQSVSITYHKKSLQRPTHLANSHSTISRWLLTLCLI